MPASLHCDGKWPRSTGRLNGKPSSGPTTRTTTYCAKSHIKTAQLTLTGAARFEPLVSCMLCKFDRQPWRICRHGYRSKGGVKLEVELTNEQRRCLRGRKEVD